MRKVIDFIKKEFELNQRQARIFMGMILLLIILIGVELYPFGNSTPAIQYSIEYVSADTLSNVVLPEVSKGSIEKVANQIPVNSSGTSEKPKVNYLGDLNTIHADSLVKVIGIGEVLSNRIVKFRDALGGFYAKDQLYEVYGLDTTVVNRLLVHVDLKADCVKLDVNLANFKEINHHPYISYEETKAIMSLRRKKIFLDSTDLQLLLSDGYEKVAPYLKY